MLNYKKINSRVFGNDWTLFDLVYTTRRWPIVEGAHLIGAGKMSGVVVEEYFVHQQLLRQ
jgi:hypothetical protein